MITKGDAVKHSHQFYINGHWQAPQGTQTGPVINPATEEEVCRITYGTEDDVDVAVAAAKAAFKTFSITSAEERVFYLEKIVSLYEAKSEALAQCVSQEMGAPISMARKSQVPIGLRHFKTFVEILKHYNFVEDKEGYTLYKQPIGVCALITPWNWPLNQISVKVAAAIAAGCTMVLKPSELAPLNAILFTEIIAESGLPAGVFNMIQGTGETVGDALSTHPDVAMVSITGSTRAGIAVAKSASTTVKRVSQELGGKSPVIVLPSADLDYAIPKILNQMFLNTGQSCSAPSRMLVPIDQLEKVKQLAKAFVITYKVGQPHDENIQMGPLANKNQYLKVNEYFKIALSEGANLLTGGLGYPTGLDKGFFVLPTVITEVKNSTKIAEDEIFGPVICVLTYSTIAEALEIANDTTYGLSGYIYGDEEEAKALAPQINAGSVHINGKKSNHMAPFGGFKASGNGREWGPLGLEEFLEMKAVMVFEG